MEQIQWMDRNMDMEIDALDLFYFYLHNIDAQEIFELQHNQLELHCMYFNSKRKILFTV